MCARFSAATGALFKLNANCGTVFSHLNRKVVNIVRPCPICPLNVCIRNIIIVKTCEEDSGRVSCACVLQEMRNYLQICVHVAVLMSGPV